METKYCKKVCTTVYTTRNLRCAFQSSPAWLGKAKSRATMAPLAKHASRHDLQHATRTSEEGIAGS